MDTNHNFTPRQLWWRAIGLLVAFAVIVFAFSVQAHCQEPSKHAPLKAALASYAALSAIDTAQTLRCVSAGRCREANPVMAAAGNARALVATKAAATSAAVAALWTLRTRHPRLVKTVAVGLAAWQGAVVISNARQLRR